jgi:hypothetical protein
MTDPMRELLLGFDARVAIESSPSDWPADRREQFLLRRDVGRPLSVDEAVWTRRDAPIVDEHAVTIATPKWTDLSIARAETSGEETLVAITVWQGLRERAMAPRGEVRPATLDAAWERLGWDVVAGYFPSAITNCGYREEDRRAWRAEWEDALNEHHLFDELPAVFAFRDARTRDVRDHEGLVVMGLYRIR